MSKLTLQDAIKKAHRAKATGAMASFKAKWDGRIPSKGSKDFTTYLADVAAVELAIKEA